MQNENENNKREYDTILNEMLAVLTSRSKDNKIRLRSLIRELKNDFGITISREFLLKLLREQEITGRQATRVLSNRFKQYEIKTQKFKNILPYVELIPTKTRATIKDFSRDENNKIVLNERLQDVSLLNRRLKNRVVHFIQID